MGATAELDIARVVAGHGRHVVLETPEGRRLIGHPRGKKSECVVGDLVRWQPSGDEGVVEHIEPRRNLLLRRDEWRTKSFAANLDRLLILVAGEPMFSESQLARALIAAEDAGIPATVLLNKIDLPAADAARERLQPYRRMGMPVVEAALKGRPDAARALLAPLLAEGATLVLGPSGTGKSTLINLMVRDAQAQVGEISAALQSGRHTTTTTTWYWLDASRRGALIDSPGFQEFGLRHLDAQRLPALMPDLREHVGECRFYNCTHREELGCGVRAAVERGEIAPSRYRIYLEILDELTRPRW
ncbi:MAG: ribosome small subunit-dependent GTPase A [Rubrivivax sp.]|nr:ribosome small subunit-dependent GTPase A [Rubrivivax sp.]